MDDVFRRKYADLTDEQKTQMDSIKVQAELLLGEMNRAIPQDERSERSRCMAVARTNLETTIMWSVKAVTTAV